MSLKTNSGILPLGFQACGISAKIKKSGKKDLALFYSPAPCVSAAVFTSNKVIAASVKITREHVRGKAAHAVVVNSGNANCMTGNQGLRDGLRMARLVAAELSLATKEVLVASTGIIGKPLPMRKIASAIPELAACLSRKGLSDAACAIMTTDRHPKEVMARVRIGKSLVTVSGIAKGAGMIAPALKSATMLAFITTDAAMTKAVLQKALNAAVKDSFNAITIDGCMSTNDMAVVLANGEAGNRIIGRDSVDARIFARALKEVCTELAKMIVRDAEGATKFIEVNVRGARTQDEAQRLALAVANSNLFKCAMFGNDPNWGRIAAALGSVPSRMDAGKLDISLNKKAVFKNGRPRPLQDNEFLKSKTVVVDIGLKGGRAQKTVYTSDLSYEYVRINAEYN